MGEGDEYSHAALLKEIRDLGGLRPYDRNFTPGAPTQKMRGEHIASQQANAQNVMTSAPRRAVRRNVRRSFGVNTLPGSVSARFARLASSIC